LIDPAVANENPVGNVKVFTKTFKTNLNPSPKVFYFEYLNIFRNNLNFATII